MRPCEPGKKLKPEQDGTQRLLDKYAEQLICVRYRYDTEHQRRYKTVELIVEDAPWIPPARMATDALVGVHVAFQEVDMPRNVKRAGGKWNSQRQLWEMRYDQVVALGLEDRIEKPKVSIRRNHG